VDVFGDFEAKPVVNDFDVHNPLETYDVFDRGADKEHVATVYVDEAEGRTEGVEPDSLYISEVLEDDLGMEDYNHLERIESEVYTDMGLEYSADVGLVEAVEDHLEEQSEI